MRNVVVDRQCVEDQAFEAHDARMHDGTNSINLFLRRDFAGFDHHHDLHVTGRASAGESAATCKAIGYVSDANRQGSHSTSDSGFSHLDLLLLFVGSGP